MTTPSKDPDLALAEVRKALARPELLDIIGHAIRKSFDEVIDGPRTGRYRIEQLEKTEKTYIGTKVEIVLRAELNLERGGKLDNLIAGHEVDTKFSLRTDWMIPREALGEICLLVTGSDNTGQCAAGLLRAAPEMLSKSENQDRKRSISKAGRDKIEWLVKGAMSRNFMLDLPEDARNAILKAPSGKQGIHTLFRMATNRLIPRRVIEQVARQKDALKRAREAKAILEPEGFRVLCAKYQADRAGFLQHGFGAFSKDDWLSVPKTPG